MGSSLSTKTQMIRGYVYADSLEEAKNLIYQEFGARFDLEFCMEKEYPIIIL